MPICAFTSFKKGFKSGYIKGSSELIEIAIECVYKAMVIRNILREGLDENGNVCIYPGDCTSCGKQNTLKIN